MPIKLLNDIVDTTEGKNKCKQQFKIILSPLHKFNLVMNLAIVDPLHGVGLEDLMNVVLLLSHY